MVRRSANNGKRRRKPGQVPVREVELHTIRQSPENDQLYRPADPKDPDIIAMAESIRKHGILDPLVITKDRYLLSGHRRYCAAELAGLKAAPCRVENFNRTDDLDRFVRLLREHNRQRVKSLDEVLREEVVSCDATEAYQSLLDYREEASCVEVETISIGKRKVRDGISAAKKPFLMAIKNVVRRRRKFWPLSVRQIHYALLNDPPLKHAGKPDSTYANDLSSYKNLDHLLTRARLEGRVPFNAISDETRPVETWNVYASHQPFIRAEMHRFLKGYYRDYMRSQPNHIEIVGEKNTVLPIIKPVAAEYCIPLTITRGYSSLPPRYEMARRFTESGKEQLLILIASDFDPDGEQIAESFARSMRDEFGLGGVKATKVALTADQIDEYDLPRSMEAKKGSANYKKFVAKYGKDVFELEALPPEDLQDILRTTIDSVIDIDLFNQEVEKEAEDAAFLENTRRRVMAVMEGVLDEEGPAP